MKILYIRDNGTIAERTLTEKEERKLPKKVLPDGTLGRYFKHHDCFAVEDKSFPISDLIGLSMVFGCEFAVFSENNNLYVKKGSSFSQGREIASNVTIPKNAEMLIHVHPVFTSFKSHLQADLKLMKNNTIEAVVDYKFNIIVYKKKDDEPKIVNSLFDDGSIQTIDYNHAEWPPFLSTMPSPNVHVILKNN